MGHLRNCRSGQAPADKRTPVTVRQELAELRPPVTGGSTS